MAQNNNHESTNVPNRFINGMYSQFFEEGCRNLRSKPWAKELNIKPPIKYTGVRKSFSMNGSQNNTVKIIIRDWVRPAMNSR